MSKHTPGPWSVYLDNRVVANVRHAGMHGALQDHIADLRDSRDPEANARLIAAAPELLRVLQDLLGLIDDGTPEDNYLEDARRAVAAATGGAR